MIVEPSHLVSSAYRKIPKHGTLVYGTTKFENKPLFGLLTETLLSMTLLVFFPSTMETWYSTITIPKTLNLFGLPMFLFLPQLEMLQLNFWT
jgi:hypothetical protein